ncbi:hypothetical protein CIK84_10245 [Glutamicibacter arilaitensis]|uniref:Uncharacterized protein n=1 Tax=Glutamicibacter arilaitensis TaxID=256701 RepID=A0A2N7S6V7_9MICC|nr:hypothetical protein CIK84_10245 [Glutamicibacter arilaitensis]
MVVVDDRRSVNHQDLRLLLQAQRWTDDGRGQESTIESGAQAASRTGGLGGDHRIPLLMLFGGL